MAKQHEPLQIERTNEPHIVEALQQMTTPTTDHENNEKDTSNEFHSTDETMHFRDASTENIDNDVVSSGSKDKIEHDNEEDNDD